MRNPKVKLFWINICLCMAITAAVFTGANLFAKGPASRSKSPAKQKKYGLASGADQVLSAIYDPAANAIRVEGSGGPGGSGTVTSVGLLLPNIFTVSGSPLTTSGTLAATLASQSQNLVLASPNGSAGVPSFRALNIADLPAINFTNLTGSVSDAQLPADAARFTGSITAGDCAKWAGSGVLADAGAACGSGSGSAVIQVNGAGLTTASPVNFQSGGYITVANPSAGNIQFNFSGPLGVANGGTGLTSLGASGQCLGTNGSVMQWQTCGSGSGFTAGGDLSGTSTSQSVVGLHFGSTALTLGAAPASGQCLEYNGTSITGAACAGGSGLPGGVNTQVQFNNSGAFGGSANLVWNGATNTLTVTGTVNATNFVTTGTGAGVTQWTSGPMSPGASGTVSCGANVNNYLACSFNGGPVMLMPALANDLGGTDPTNPQVVGFHLTSEGETGNSPVTFSIANDTATGTTQYKLAKIINESGSPFAIAAATTDTSIPVYMTASATATSGNARLVIAGSVGTCTFDGAATIGDYVVASTTIAGDCHDAGATAPSSGFIAGQVISTVAAAGSTGSVKSLVLNASSGGSSTAFQINTTPLSSSSPVNFESGTGISVSNPGAGNISIAQNPATVFFSGVHSGAQQNVGANIVRVSGFYLPYPVTFSHITFVIDTADATTGDLYDVGVYTHAGVLEADIGATAFTTAGSEDMTTKQGAVTLSPGQYYLAFTGNASTAALDDSPCASFYPVNGASAGSSSGGALPSSFSPPADVFTTWSMCFDFALH